MNETEKKAIALKIKALLTKTTEAGCSEEEALAAMHKAHELLAKYQIDLSELEIREEGTDETFVAMSQISSELQAQVGKYCEVKGWRNSKEGLCYFLGLKSDVFFAEWLLLALTGFVQRKTLEYSLESGSIYQHEVMDFQIGCIQRINSRLRDEIASREAERQRGTGRDLIPLKNVLITEAWAKKNLTLRPGQSNRQGQGSAHFSAGYQAGGEARFSRPVARDEFSQRQIGQSRGAK